MRDRESLALALFRAWAKHERTDVETGQHPDGSVEDVTWDEIDGFTQRGYLAEASAVFEWLKAGEQERLHQQMQGMLWEIAEGVAADSTYPTDTDIHDVPHNWVCPFCRGESTGYTDQFPHDKDCIVTKAHELTAWRKAQPHISTENTESEVPHA